MTTETKMGMHNGIGVPSVLHGSDTWKINARLRKKVDDTEMSCLRPVRGVNVRAEWEMRTLELNAA